VEGRSLVEIAALLSVDRGTATSTCIQINGKLGVIRAADLMGVAFELGLT